MYSRLNPSEIKPMCYNDKISHLVIEMERWVSGIEWRNLIEYVLKHEAEPIQFTLLDVLLERMSSTSISAFQDIFLSTPDLALSKSLRTFFLLLGVTLCYGGSSMYYIERGFETVVKNYGLLKE